MFEYNYAIFSSITSFHQSSIKIKTFLQTHDTFL